VSKLTEELATPAGLARLSAMSDPVAEELLRLRMSIDNMDAALVHLLAERFKVTQQVGELKAAHGLPPADPTREAQQIARLRALAEDAKLDPEFAEKFLNFVVAEVVRHHEATLNRLDSDAYVSHQNDGNERSITP
jgi:chorismate mutase